MNVLHLRILRREVEINLPSGPSMPRFRIEPLIDVTRSKSNKPSELELRNVPDLRPLLSSRGRHVGQKRSIGTAIAKGISTTVILFLIKVCVSGNTGIKIVQKST